MTIFTLFALIATFLLAFSITALLVPPIQRLGIRRGWVQKPGGRRTHTQPTTNIGGVAIYVGSMVAFVATLAFERIDPTLQRSSFETLRVGLVLFGGSLMFVVMWLDDVRELHWSLKFITQVVAALIAVGPFLWDRVRYLDPNGMPTEARGILLTAFNFPFTSQVDLYAISPWLAIIATVFWIGWMSNTVNFVDGLDGLAAGVSLIAAIMLALHALRLNPAQFTIALLPLAIAGACGGFLIFNFPPAKIFMGGGAEFLGYMLGVSAIIGGAKLATVLLVLGVPILDVAWLIVARTMAGRSPMQGGRDHLHLRLRDLGFSGRQIVLFYYGLSASFGLVGISGASQIAKLAALGVLALIGASVIGYAMWMGERRKQRT
jgi:UDP-N-acetylmuramyl pentapeptide phosphotransferase/UDP-N-acetylglucosamine-1-phosphate transferase